MGVDLSWRHDYLLFHYAYIALWKLQVLIWCFSVDYLRWSAADIATVYNNIYFVLFLDSKWVSQNEKWINCSPNLIKGSLKKWCTWLSLSFIVLVSSLLLFCPDRRICSSFCLQSKHWQCVCVWCLGSYNTKQCDFIARTIVFSLCLVVWYIFVWTSKRQGNQTSHNTKLHKWW